MTRRIVLYPLGRAAVLALGVALILTTQSSADKTDGPDNRLKDKSSTAHKPVKKTIASSTKRKKKRLPPITNLKVDPKAQHVPLFDGVAGRVADRETRRAKRVEWEPLHREPFEKAADGRNA